MLKKQCYQTKFTKGLSWKMELEKIPNSVDNWSLYFPKISSTLTNAFKEGDGMGERDVGRNKLED